MGYLFVFLIWSYAVQRSKGIGTNTIEDKQNPNVQKVFERITD